MSAEWFEVWADVTADPAYVLLVRPMRGGFEVLDPAQGGASCFRSDSYDEVVAWLLEDEYEMIRGRTEVIA